MAHQKHKRSKIRQIKHRIKKRLYRFKFYRNMQRNHRMKRAVYAAVIAVLLILIIFVIYTQTQGNRFDVSEYTSSSNSADLRDYEFNSNIVNILFIGIDSEDSMEAKTEYGDQAQALSINLISFNTKDNIITILPISKDTIAKVGKFTKEGHKAGKVETQLANAYAYGNGGNDSSLNVCNAVRDLLYDTHIQYYVSSNRKSIRFINNLVDGVSLEVPNNDLKHEYPEMRKGATVRITDHNVAAYLGYIDKSKAGSNEGRMQRQQVYFAAFINKLASLSEDDCLNMWDKISKNTDGVKTNIDKEMFISLVSQVCDYEFGEDHILSIDGDNKTSNGLNAFIPDSEALKTLVIRNYLRLK